MPTPLETLRSAACRKIGLSTWALTPEEAYSALRADGHLPAPDITITVTLTPEEADAFADAWEHPISPQLPQQRAAIRVRDAILEARGQ